MLADLKLHTVGLLSSWEAAPVQGGPLSCAASAGCMLVELETGAPLFPGTSDVDQLWRIMQCLCSASVGYAGIVHAQPTLKVWIPQHALCMACGQGLSTNIQ